MSSNMSNFRFYTEESGDDGLQLMDRETGQSVTPPLCAESVYGDGNWVNLAHDLNLYVGKMAAAQSPTPSVEDMIVHVAKERLKHEYTHSDSYDPEDDYGWVIEDTPGFELHHEELAKFAHDWRASEIQRRADQRQREAAAMGVSVELAQQINSLRMTASQQAQSAKNLLLHYFREAGIVQHADNVVEVESIVDHLVGAAEAKLKSELLLEKGREANKPAADVSRNNNGPELS